MRERSWEGPLREPRSAWRRRHNIPGCLDSRAHARQRCASLHDRYSPQVSVLDTTLVAFPGNHRGRRLSISRRGGLATPWPSSCWGGLVLRPDRDCRYFRHAADLKQRGHIEAARAHRWATCKVDNQLINRAFTSPSRLTTGLQLAMKRCWSFCRQCCVASASAVHQWLGGLEASRFLVQGA